MKDNIFEHFLTNPTPENLLRIMAPENQEELNASLEDKEKANALLDKTLDVDTMIETKQPNPSSQKSNGREYIQDEHILGMKKELIDKLVNHDAMIPNELKVIFHKRHVHAQFSCMKCVEGQIARVNIGKYPGNHELSKTDLAILTLPYDISNFIKNLASGSLTDASVDFKEFAIKALVTFLDHTALSGIVRGVYSDDKKGQSPYEIVNEFGGSYPTNILHHKFVEIVTKSELDKLPSITYKISDEGAERAIKYLALVVNHNKGTAYKFFAPLKSSNCIGFVEELWQESGLTGNFVDPFIKNMFRGNTYGFPHVLPPLINRLVGVLLGKPFEDEFQKSKVIADTSVNDLMLFRPNNNTSNHSFAYGALSGGARDVSNSNGVNNWLAALVFIKAIGFIFRRTRLTSPTKPITTNSKKTQTRKDSKKSGPAK